MKEIWKCLTGLDENYYISSMGRIKTIDRITAPDAVHPFGQLIKGRILSSKNTKHRYESVIVKPLQKRFYIHRLVAAYFLGKNQIPHGYEVNHKNGKTKDNRVENLEIISHKDNMHHATKILNRWQAQKQRQNKKVLCIELNRKFDSMKTASEFFGNYQNKGGGISMAIKTGCRALGYHWKYI